MSEHLVIRLHSADADHASWVVVDESGAQITTPVSGVPSSVGDAARNRRVVLLAPADVVLRTAADIPVRGQAKILQALPFAMEEQLADDIDDLHFAIGRRDDDAAVPVAAVRREHMDAWTEMLREAQLEPVAIYSECDGVDSIPGTAVLLLETTQACFRNDRGELSVADPDNIATLLRLWLSNHDGDVQPHLIVYADQAVSEATLVELEGLRPDLQSLDIKILADGALPRLAAQVTVNGGINLMQGDYVKRSDLARYWPAWRVAAALLLGLGVAAAGATLAEIWHLDRRAAQLQTAIEQAFRYTFPGAREIRGTRAELQSRLRALGQASDSEPSFFLDALQVVSRAILQGGSNSRLEGLDYRSGVMELRVRVPNVETLDRIEKVIDGAEGMQAEIQSANADDGEVLGRLRLEVSGA
ncbi:MAG: type II secretion system protein GspL [Gammaproteobacteria bacterium]|nr:type II secretion system protein GspL [Gammaproteobacteria bacterium]